MRVAVVGAGIAGLTAAWELSRRGHDVVVLDGADRIGGKLHTGDVGGVQLDLGAESVLARRPEAVGLIEAVGLSDRVENPVTTSAGVWTRGAVRPLPPTVLGVPADLDALAASGIVDEVRTQAVPVPAHDLSVGEFVTQRAGREVLQRLVEPLLGGVYAGHADAISLRAAAPQLLALGDDPVAAAVAARAAASDTPVAPVFAGIVGGVGTLPQALAERSGAEVRTGSTVRIVERSGDGWRLMAGPVGAVEEVLVDAVVVATPAPATILTGAPWSTSVMKLE